MRKVYTARRYVLEPPEGHGCGSELIILQGKEGVVIVKTQLAILVAHYPEGVQPGQATTTVEQLGDYLIGVGY